MIDVLVVGAGPVGLTLAIDLARRGVRLRVIEQSLTPQIGTRGRGISLRTQHVFEDLGALADLLPYDEGWPPVRTYDRDQLLSEVDSSTRFPAVPQPYRPILMINQEHTEAVLRAKLASFGVSIEMGTRLTDFTQHADHVVARVGDAGETIEARYLVGCDGGRGVVRKLAGISFVGETWDEEQFLLGNIGASGLDPRFSYRWGGLGMTLQWMSHSDTWFFSAAVARDAAGALPTASLESLQQIFDERAGMKDVRFDRPHWLSLWRPNIRMVDRYRAGRVFLAGDAAHVHSAAGGQGMNTGVQDAYNLGWKLARVSRGAPDALLDTYQAERLPIARGVLASTSARHREYQRDFGRAVDTLISGQETFADPSQMTLHYRGSPLAVDLDDATRVRAGDRAPDAPYTRAGSADRTRLFDLFRGPHFTLLVFGDPQLLDLPRAYRETLRVHVVSEDDREARAAYGVSRDALVLVRPDGYVGLTGGTIDRDRLVTFLATIIGG